MDEQRKDQIEDLSQDLGGATLEALVSLVPGVGPFLAVFTNRMMGSSFERRTKGLIGELRDDLMALEASGRVAFTEELAQDDQFQAAVHRTIRRLLESGSADKRKLLRNALLNRVQGFAAADAFERALDACGPEDIRVLVALDEETQRELPGHRLRAVANWAVPQAFERWGEPMPDLLATRVALLTSLGLLDEEEKSEIKEREKPSYRRGRSSERQVERTVHTSVEVTVSEFGERFLEYLKDPLDPGEGEQEGASAPQS